MRTFQTFYLALGFLFFFACASCGKSTNPKKRIVCENIICPYGSICDYDTCRCPGGYEGMFCDTPSRDKFIGCWAGFTERLSGDLMNPRWDTMPDTVWFTADTGHIKYMKGGRDPLFRFYQQCMANPYGFATSPNSWHGEFIYGADTVLKIMGSAQIGITYCRKLP